jgi:hypothetical protein
LTLDTPIYFAGLPQPLPYKLTYVQNDKFIKTLR